MDDNSFNLSIEHIYKWCTTQLGNKFKESTWCDAFDILNHLWKRVHYPILPRHTVAPSQQAANNQPVASHTTVATQTVNESSNLRPNSQSRFTRHSNSPLLPEDEEILRLFEEDSNGWLISQDPISQNNVNHVVSEQVNPAINTVVVPSSGIVVPTISTTATTTTTSAQSELINLMENTAVVFSSGVQNLQAANIVQTNVNPSATSIQTDICSFIGSQPSDGAVISTQVEKIGGCIASSKCRTILLGDNNWKQFVPPPALQSSFCKFIYSGKVSSARNIFDKISQPLTNLDNFIFCVGCDNYSADIKYILPFITTIKRVFETKFISCKIFVCLIGICNSLPENHKLRLESINNAIRSKFQNAILISSPDNFTATNNIFSQDTKTFFYNQLNSFLS